MTYKKFALTSLSGIARRLFVGLVCGGDLFDGERVCVVHWAELTMPQRRPRPNRVVVPEVLSL